MTRDDFFKKELDKEGRVVHGSFLDNFDGILEYGISPPSMLPPQSKPKRFFGNKTRGRALFSAANYSSNIVIGDENHYSLSERKLWSPFFHYFVVCDHPNWGEVMPKGNSLNRIPPYYYRSSELVLYNQQIPPEEFVGVVIYTDEELRALAETKKGRTVFGVGEELMTTERIRFELDRSLSMVGLELPLFDFDGRRLEGGS